MVNGKWSSQGVLTGRVTFRPPTLAYIATEGCSLPKGDQEVLR